MKSLSFIIISLLTPNAHAAVIGAIEAPSALVPSGVLPALASTPNSLPLNAVPASLAPSIASPLPSPVPVALQAVAPLVAASIDAKLPLENSAAAGESLVAVLQGGNPLRSVEVSEVVPGVLHMKFPSQRLMASTMLRFQEHYESPKFRNKAFTLDEFKKWYAKNQSKTGTFSYYQDWEGFNIPSRILRRFIKGDFAPLSSKERALLEIVSGRQGRFYLIATAGKDGDPETLRHEVAHGLWYTRPDYRRRAQALLKGVDLVPVFAMLENLGYHKSVWLDEAHAWLADPPKYVRQEGLDPRPYREIRKKLLALQKEYVSDLF
jgi:hypothetical protein